ncbi:thiolase family protein [Amycolatopsis nigrescens]|uniref:thiolase family protein n=1 Tax=Amycolatopsis nigrescens TaxID=381445 RepID=UPI000370ADF7|nr:thiolase family protein [Amycolatopsis nigrescens]
MSETPMIVAARRSAIGRAGGIFGDLPLHRLAAPVLTAALEDSGASASEVSEVLLGNVFGPGGNSARVAALEAGLGVESSAVTVDRQCASGLEAVHLAATMVAAGRGGLYLAGGAESPSTAPWRAERPRSVGEPPRFYSRAPFAPAAFGDPEMGAAADLVAAEAGISRARQDEYAAESHRKAIETVRAGGFDAEIVPIDAHCTDQRPRAGLTAARLARLRPAFSQDGTTTAGNSCGVNDGAAVVAVASESWCADRGLRGLRIVDWAASGVDPRRLGLGPVPAVRTLLERNGLTVAELGVVEFNEAFAGQVLACLDALGIAPELVCPDGGAIALGHPWGASGAVLMVRLFSRMMRADGPRFGLAVIAAGGGQGLATLVRRD